MSCSAALCIQLSQLLYLASVSKQIDNTCFDFKPSGVEVKASFQVKCQKAIRTSAVVHLNARKSSNFYGANLNLLTTQLDLDDILRHGCQDREYRFAEVFFRTGCQDRLCKLLVFFPFFISFFFCIFMDCQDSQS